MLTRAVARLKDHTVGPKSVDDSLPIVVFHVMADSLGNN